MTDSAVNGRFALQRTMEARKNIVTEAHRWSLLVPPKQNGPHPVLWNIWATCIHDTKRPKS